MPAIKSAEISLRLADVRALRLRDSGLETLRALAGPGSRPLGHDLGAGYAFLAVDASGTYAGTLTELIRSFVFLPDPGALIDFDIAVAGGAPATVNWKLDVLPSPDTITTVLPRPADAGKAAAESLGLHVVWLNAPQPVGAIDSIELAGLRIGDRVVAFYNETRTARSAVSFDVAGPPSLQFLITGLAPGEWEVWFAGMLEIPDAEVRPEASALSFKGKPGGYFLRRLGS